MANRLCRFTPRIAVGGTGRISNPKNVTQQDLHRCSEFTLYDDHLNITSSREVQNELGTVLHDWYLA